MPLPTLKYVYWGDSVTYHPVLGRLVPGETQEDLEPRVRPAAEAGLIEIVDWLVETQDPVPEHPGEDRDQDDDQSDDQDNLITLIP